MGDTIMTPRQRTLKALDHKEPDRIPIGYTSNSEAREKLKKYLNIKNDNELLKRLGVDIRPVFPEYIGPKDLFMDLPWERSGKDIWGIERKKVTNTFGTYCEITGYPLKNIEDAGELETYPWPKIEWFDFDSLNRQINELEKENHYCISLFGGLVFEQSWYMRGFEQFLMDLLIKPDIAHKIMEKIFNFWISMIQESVKATGDRIDLIMFGDDLASQEGLLISVDTWKKMVKPWYEKFYLYCHEHGKKTVYHSCGSIGPFIEEFISIGLDVLNVLQFSAKDFPPPEVLKEKYGSRLCFLGGMDIQKVLPYYSTEDIKKETKKLISILGKNGGYIIRTTHNIQADIPPENIMAMYDTALSSTY
jgi:uroporphyrinogen decarboxylase